MIEAARLYRFSAVHSLPGFPGPWSRVHGHRYTVEIVGDFNHEQADERWQWLATELEHSDLNKRLNPTTVEALAVHFLSEFEDLEGVRQVTVWEDDDRWGRATR